MKKIFYILMTSLLLSGCGSTKTTTVCDISESSNSISEVITLHSTDDKITTYVSNMIIDYGSYYLKADMSEEEKQEDLNKILDGLNNKYENIKGIKWSAKINEYKINGTLKIDLKKVSQKDLVNIGLLEKESKDGYLSLKSTVSGLEDSNGKCSEK